MIEYCSHCVINTLYEFCGSLPSKTYTRLMCEVGLQSEESELDDGFVKRRCHLIFFCFRSGLMQVAWSSTCPCSGSNLKNTTCSDVPFSLHLSTQYRYGASSASDFCFHLLLLIHQLLIQFLFTLSPLLDSCSRRGVTTDATQAGRQTVDCGYEGSALTIRRLHHTR